MERLVGVLAVLLLAASCQYASHGAEVPSEPTRPQTADLELPEAPSTTIPETTTTSQPAPATTVLPSTTTTQVEVEIGQPVSLSIESPSLDIEGEIYPHGPELGPILFPEKQMVAWWTGQGYVEPGQPGPAVLAAHVTDLFKGLVKEAEDETLSVDFNEVRLVDSNGATLVFKVDGQPVRYLKKEVPWETVIYPVSSERVVWLFTCGGEDLDGDGSREYNDVVRLTLESVIQPDGSSVHFSEEG